MPQQIDLFSGSVLENIAPGQDQLDLRKAVYICDMLGFLPTIESLPMGFDTLLGENGLTLSGGERQRLAIARTLYQDPYVLALDEATSSMDSVAESYVWQVMEHWRQAGHIVIVIAHRLASAARAQQVIVLHDGTVVERGRHPQLLRQNSTYSKMWAYQHGSLGPEMAAEPA